VARHQRVRRRLKTQLILAALRAANVATRRLPRVEVGEPVCRLAGALWFLAAPTARAAVRDNLRHVLGREPTRREVASVFRNGALNYWDTFAIPHVSRQDLLNIVDFVGIEHLVAARRKGNGVIVASAHLGSVALVAQLIPALGFPTTGLVEPIDPPEAFDFFARQREAHGARLLPAGRAAVRELLQALHRNEVLGLVADRDVTGNGLMIQFFDAPTRFADGTAALSVRTGAPILVGACARKAGGRFDAWIEPLPAVELTGDTKADVLRLTRAVAERLQYYVASHPEQWTVFQRRWPHQSAARVRSDRR
jgi:KDO2-lipid IV(A) lauroyltransferase